MLTRLWGEIDSFFARDPSARSRLEVLLCYPGLHAVLFYRLSHWLWVRKFKLVARILSHIARMLTGIEIHPGATIGQHLFIDHGMGVVIGETSNIGDNVTIYHGVTLGGVSHEGGIRHPQIENHVVIGAGAQLLGPIRIGEGAKIGSNAVVVRDVEPGDTMVGVPARKVRQRTKKSDSEEFAAYATDHGTIVDPTKRDIELLKKELAAVKALIATDTKKTTKAPARKKTTKSAS